MRSAVWDRSVNHAISPEEPEVIQLRTEAISSHSRESRQGIEGAAVGAITATAVLRQDLRLLRLFGPGSRKIGLKPSSLSLRVVS